MLALKLPLAIADWNCLKAANRTSKLTAMKAVIKEYIAYMNRDKQPLHEEVIFIQGERNNVQVEVSLQWCIDAYSDNVLGFANNIRTIDGGTHLEGLKAVLTRTMNAIARKRNKIKENEPNLGGENIQGRFDGRYFCEST